MGGGEPAAHGLLFSGERALAFDLVSTLAGFLAGTATGAAGKYLADRMTDQRRRQESQCEAKDRLKSIRAIAPGLLEELATDLQQNRVLREVIILPNRRIQYSHLHDRIVLYEEERPHVRNEMSVLCNADHARQTQAGNYPLYVLQEAFVSLLLT